MMPNGRYAYPEEVLADISLVAWRLGRVPKMYEYSEMGKFHGKTAAGKFGSWDAACFNAGLVEPVTEETINRAVEQSLTALREVEA